MRSFSNSPDRENINAQDAKNCEFLKDSGDRREHGVYKNMNLRASCRWRSAACGRVASGSGGGRAGRVPVPCPPRVAAPAKASPRHLACYSAAALAILARLEFSHNPTSSNEQPKGSSEILTQSHVINEQPKGSLDLGCELGFSQQSHIIPKPWLDSGSVSSVSSQLGFTSQI